MYLPPLPSLTQTKYVSGDVTVHPSAAIAPGVILKTGPNGHIIINAGVCIGMGSILNAYQGTIEIETGATLGSGVLVVGQGKIGSQASIGTATTIYNTSVNSHEVISPYSVLGDTSRQIQITTEVEATSQPVTKTTATETTKTTETTEFKAEILDEPWFSEAVAPEEVEGKIEPEPPPETTPISTSPVEEKERERVPVVGKVYINQLLLTLFPERPSR